MLTLLPRIRIHILTVFAIMGLPLFSFFAKRRRAGNMDEKRPRILVVPQLTRIGDLICTTPVFKEIKKRYPESFLAVAVNQKIGGIIENNPNVDKVFVLKDEEYFEFFGIFHRLRRIQNEQFDWSINLASSTVGTLMSVYGLIPHHIKIIKKRKPFSEVLTDWMNTHTLSYEDGEHIPTLYLKTLRFLDISVPREVRKEVFTTTEGDTKAEHFLRKYGIKDSERIVGMCVAAGNNLKEWPVTRFGMLAERLIVLYRVRVVLIGSHKDKEKTEKVNTHIGNTGIDAAGTFSLEELPSLMKRFSVFISADTGVIHIAEALSVPLIDIVGPVDPCEQTPQGKKSIIIKPPPDIKPTIFAFRPAGDLKESKRAVEAITVDDVLKAFDTLYSKLYA